MNQTQKCERAWQAYRAAEPKLKARVEDKVKDAFYQGYLMALLDDKEDNDRL